MPPMTPPTMAPVRFVTLMEPPRGRLRQTPSSVMGNEIMLAVALQLLSEKSVHDDVVVTEEGLVSRHADEPPMHTEQLPLLVPQVVQPTLPARVRSGRRAGVGDDGACDQLSAQRQLGQQQACRK